MKIYIDNHETEGAFAMKIQKRIKKIEGIMNILSFDNVAISNPDATEEDVANTFDDCDIIIPIVTSAYLAESERIINEKLNSLISSNTKYILPIIYSPSNWSSINWIVKSKVFPDNGTAYTELTDNEKVQVLNNIVRTIENIIAKNTADKSIKKNSTKSKNEMVFISHSHDDADFAELLKLKLEKVGINGWVDEERLKIGQDWRLEIDDGITNSIALIVIMTPEARKSEYVTYEWAYAWGKEIKIFPIMLKQTTLHPRLESLQYMDFTNRPTRPYDKLIEELKQLKK